MPDINPNLKQAHARAWSEVKEDDSLPNIDVGVLISFLFDMFKSDTNERFDIIKKYAKTYGKSFMRYGKLLSEDLIPKTINEFLQSMVIDDFNIYVCSLIAIIIALITAHVNTAIPNPVLFCLGYHFYSVGAENGISGYVLISKRKLRSKRALKNVNRFFEFVLLDAED